MVALTTLAGVLNSYCLCCISFNNCFLFLLVLLVLQQFLLPQYLEVLRHFRIRERSVLDLQYWNIYGKVGRVMNLGMEVCAHKFLLFSSLFFSLNLSMCLSTLSPPKLSACYLCKKIILVLENVCEEYGISLLFIRNEGEFIK